MKVGIVCDLSYDRSTVINTYYYTVKSLYGDVILVKEPRDLEGLDIVFVGNEHFQPHRQIWTSDWFVKGCNKNGIQVIIISGEKILNSPYWHSGVSEMQEIIGSFDKLKQYVWDVDDCKQMQLKLMGYAVSHHFRNCVEVPEAKLNKCVFIGQYMAPEYAERREILKAINQVIETDIITNFSGNWKDYLTIYSKYRYVLSPISGISNAFCYRFYEALLVNSIPVHQIRSQETLMYYPQEAKVSDSIYFTNIEDVKEKLGNFKQERATSSIWFEDKMKTMLKEDGIFVP